MRLRSRCSRYTMFVVFHRCLDIPACFQRLNCLFNCLLGAAEPAFCGLYITFEWIEAGHSACVVLSNSVKSVRARLEDIVFTYYTRVKPCQRPSPIEVHFESQEGNMSTPLQGRRSHKTIENQVYKTLISETSLWDRRKVSFLCIMIKLFARLKKWTVFETRRLS